MATSRPMWPASFVLLVSFGVTLPSSVAQAPSPANSDLQTLAGKLVDPIQKSGAKRVVVLDLRGAAGEHPAGIWLADQISVALQARLPELALIDRAAVKPVANGVVHEKPIPGFLPSDRETGRSVGADAIVTGSYASYGKVIGITLAFTEIQNRAAAVRTIAAAIPVSPEILAISPEPLPEFKDGTFRAGTAGVSVPSCIYCPDPPFSEKARRAKQEGVVVLNVSLLPDGRVSKVALVKGAGYGLDERAQEVVMTWKLKPATDWAGNPVPVTVPVEVSFRLLRNP